MSLLVDIRKNFGDFSLEAFFEVKNREFIGLLGASGSGKSVTLKCISGVETPDEGKIILNGETLFDSSRKINVPPRKRKIGYLLQNYGLFPNMTVAQNIACGVQKGKEKGAVTTGLLQALDLEICKELYPYQISGGQQQRTALARILAAEPRLLLLDEPFSALDSYLKWKVELEFTNFLKELRGPAVFVTHSRDEVRRLCGKVCVINRGKTQTVQTVTAFLDSPKTLSACALSGCKNISRAERLENGMLKALDWGMELRTSQPSNRCTHIGIRARSILVAKEPGINCFECKVERVIEEMFSVMVMLCPPGKEESRSHLSLILPKETWLALEEPNWIFVELPAESLLLLTED